MAGSTLLGITVTELQAVAKGWSVKRILLGQPDNDKNERVGSVDDLIVTPEKAASYAIISAGGRDSTQLPGVACSPRDLK